MFIDKYGMGMRVGPAQPIGPVGFAVVFPTSKNIEDKVFLLFKNDDAFYCEF